MNLNNEQINVETQPEASEQQSIGEKQTGISLGKFKDVNALLNAYNSLESEFTKRCQKIKELEGKLNGDNTAVPLASEGEAIVNEQSENLIQEDVLKDYLKSVIVGKQQAVLINDSGVGVKTPVSRPKTIAEAGMLAKELL